MKDRAMLLKNKLEQIRAERFFNSKDALDQHNLAKHSSEVKSYKKLYIGLFILVLIIGVLFFNKYNTDATKEIVDENIQRITLGFTNNYEPNTIYVKSGIPVEITLDKTVKGCFRGFNINDLGVSKLSSNPDDVIKFTPTNKGSFRFNCGMNMGYGTIVVE